MSVSTAIGMVSESLRNLLVGEMTLTPSVEVTLLAPDESGGERRINLFLYRILENSALKNVDWQVKRGEPSRIVPPPLSLNLYYLMTPYAQNDPLTGNATAHEMLGEAMRVFHEHAIVPQNALVQGLHGAAGADQNYAESAGPGRTRPGVEHVLTAVSPLCDVRSLRRPVGVTQ